jgi:hypothetical protein
MLNFDLRREEKGKEPFVLEVEEAIKVEVQTLETEAEEWMAHALLNWPEHLSDQTTWYVDLTPLLQKPIPVSHEAMLNKQMSWSLSSEIQK